MTRAAVLVGISVVALHLVACSRFRSARQCEHLIELVNGALDEVEATPGLDPPTAKAYETVSARFNRLAADLEKEKLVNVNLAKSVDDYRKVFLSAARTAHTFAEALKNKDGPKLPAVRAAATQVAHKQRAIGRRIDAICQP